MMAALAWKGDMGQDREWIKGNGTCGQRQLLGGLHAVHWGWSSVG